MSTSTCTWRNSLAAVLIAVVGLLMWGAPAAAQVATGNVAGTPPAVGQPDRYVDRHYVDAAVVNTDWAIKAGIKIPQERIAQEKVANNPYRNFIAVNAKDAQAPWVKALVESYQQANVASSILSVYHGATLPACMDIKTVVDSSDAGLDLRSTVAQGTHS